MTSIFKKTLLAGLAAATLVTGIAASTAPASAFFPIVHPPHGGPHMGGWGHGGWGHGGWGRGFGVGVVSGVAVGAIATSSYGDCYLVRRPVYDEAGDFLGYRAVRACN